MKSPDVPPPSTDRTRRRRQGWAAASAGGFAACVVVFWTLGAIPAGGAGAIFLAFVFVTLASLVVVALVALALDTFLLHGRPPELARHARPPGKHGSGRDDNQRYLPRARNLLAWACLIALIGIGVRALPGLIDAVAYFAGAERTVMFLPTSYGQSCARYSCNTVTDGILETAGGVSARWESTVPLGRPFPVHEPLWNWGFGSVLIDGGWTAVGLICAGILLNTVAVFVAIISVKIVRRWLRHRAERRQPTAPA